MELVSTYLNSNYVSLFGHVKNMFYRGGIHSTPEIASLIEQSGISRHMYKKDFYSTEPYEFKGAQEFYKLCLGFVIFLIDEQRFDSIEQVFEYEKMVNHFNSDLNLGQE